MEADQLELAVADLSLDLCMDVDFKFDLNEGL